MLFNTLRARLRRKPRLMECYSSGAMFCPQCQAEYREGFVECADCHVRLVDRLFEPGTLADSLADPHDQVGEADLDVLIQTGCDNPVAIGLAKTLLQEARIPFFAMDQNPTA